MSTAIKQSDDIPMVETETVCPECEGSKTVGRFATVRPWSDNPYDLIRQTCPKCLGEGVIVIDLCQSCGKDENECKGNNIGIMHLTHLSL